MMNASGVELSHS